MSYRYALHLLLLEIGPTVKSTLPLETRMPELFQLTTGRVEKVCLMRGGVLAVLRWFRLDLAGQFGVFGGSYCL